MLPTKSEVFYFIHPEILFIDKIYQNSKLNAPFILAGINL